MGALLLGGSTFEGMDPQHAIVSGLSPGLLGPRKLPWTSDIKAKQDSHTTIRLKSK